MKVLRKKREKAFFLISLTILICSNFGYGADNCIALYPFDEYKSESGNHQYGYIDCKGNIIVEAKLEYTSEFNDGVGFVRIDDENDGIVNLRGEIKILTQINILSDFYDGVAIARIQGKYGIIDKMGKPTAFFKFEVVSNDYRSSSTNFSDGLAAISTPTGISFIDKNGNIVLNQKDAIRTSGFNNGLAAITFENGNVAVINKKGKYIVNPISSNEQLIGIPSEGLINLGKHKFSGIDIPQWKYINSEGKVVLQVSYDYAGDFKEGLARIAVDGKWGYMDKEGNKIPNKFDDAEDFSEGLAIVKINNNYGFINPKGDIVISPTFDYGSKSFRNGLAYVQKQDIEGYINKKAEWIWKRKVVLK